MIGERARAELPVGHRVSDLRICQAESPCFGRVLPSGGVVVFRCRVYIPAPFS